MIARLRGEVIERQPPWVVLDVGGVGYQVEVPLSTFDRLPYLGEQVILLTEMVVREDAQLLYGFASARERELFRLLVKVNGVGPKLALAVLSAMSVDAFVQAVRDKEVARLVKIPGVGKKTAERLVLELGSSVESLPGVFTLSADGRSSDAAAAAGQADAQLRQQAQQALAALGYRDSEVAARLDAVWQAELGLSELIRRALQVSL